MTAPLQFARYDPTSHDLSSCHAFAVGYAEVVIQDDVLRCQTAEQPYLGVLGPPQSSSSNDDLPAWAWVLIALAAVFVGALLAAGGIWGYRHRQRKRATPPIDLPAPASGDPAGSPPGPQGTLAAAGDLFPLSNWSIDFSKAAEATDVDIAALIQLRDAWRTRIGLAHGLEFHDVLGRGGFGSVYRATWHSTVVAVKLVEHSVDSALTRHIQREAALSTSVSHPNIVVTYKVCTVGLKDLQKLPHYVEVSSAAATVGGQRVAPRASPVPPEDDVFDNTETASGDIEMARKSGTSTQRQAASGRAPTVEQNQGAAPSSSTTSDALPSSSSSVLERQASAAFPDDLVATLIVMEFCDLGTVHRAAHDWHAFDINDDPTGKDLVSLLFVLVDVGMALDYLHNVSGIRHGDVKPANVLLKSAGSTRRGWMAKLSDLGVAKMLDPMGRHSATTIDLTGTQNYLAPEQLVAHTQLTKATDCYAFGLLSEFAQHRAALGALCCTYIIYITG